jgi:hypothetical protein
MLHSSKLVCTCLQQLPSATNAQLVCSPSPASKGYLCRAHALPSWTLTESKQADACCGQRPAPPHVVLLHGRQVRRTQRHRSPKTSLSRGKKNTHVRTAQACTPVKPCCSVAGHLLRWWWWWWSWWWWWWCQLCTCSVATCTGPHGNRTAEHAHNSSKGRQGCVTR